MILNGKAKEKFLEWISLNNLFTIEDREKYFNSLSELFQNALIIEFFNEQEYKIEIGVYNLWNHCFAKCYWDRGFKEYKQSVEQAIKKANDLYNENNSMQMQTM